MKQDLLSSHGPSQAPAQQDVCTTTGDLSNTLQAGLDKMRDFACMSQPPHPVSLLVTLRPCLYLKDIPVKQQYTWD